MNFYLIKMLTNTQGQDGSAIAVYSTLQKALVAYHQTLATYHNAPDVLYAIVKIENELGNAEAMEIVDHRPPAPEPEPRTIVSIVDEGDYYTVTYSDGTVETYPKPQTEAEPEPEPTEEPEVEPEG